MTGYRCSDETLDAEVETLEAIARLRLRRYTRDLQELDRDLRELKREQAARRRARAGVLAESDVPATAHVDGST